MKLQLKRSSSTTGSTGALAPVAPTEAQTLKGELCVNFNSGDPALYIEDTAGNIVRVDGNTDTYALSTTTNTSQGDIVLTHDGTGNNNATTDTVSILAGTNIAVSSNGTDITIASSVPSSGQFGYWTRSNTPNVLSPVNAGDNISTTGEITSGTLNLNEDAVIIFEGATNNANETTLTVTDPTADREITLPDASGNVTLDPGTPTVTSQYVREVTDTGVTSWVDLDTILPSGDLTGTAERRVLVWKGSGSVTAIGAASGNSAITIAGNYDAPTTVSPSGGTGLRVAFTLDGSGVVSNFRIASPGEGYSTSDTITVAAGHNFTTTVSTVTNSAQWNATQNQELAEGPGTENIFLYNGKTISSDYSIRQGLNAMSAGPITINNGVTVTIGNGESWAIV